MMNKGTKTHLHPIKSYWHLGIICSRSFASRGFEPLPGAWGVPLVADSIFWLSKKESCIHFRWAIDQMVLVPFTHHRARLPFWHFFQGSTFVFCIWLTFPWYICVNIGILRYFIHSCRSSFLSLRKKPIGSLNAGHEYKAPNIKSNIFSVQYLWAKYKSVFSFRVAIYYTSETTCDSLDCHTFKTFNACFKMQLYSLWSKCQNKLT